MCVRCRESYADHRMLRYSQDGVYGYGLPYTANLAPRTNLPLTSANKLYRTIKDNFGTLVFCRRQLAHLGCERYLAGVSFFLTSILTTEYIGKL